MLENTPAYVTAKIKRKNIVLLFGYLAFSELLYWTVLRNILLEVKIWSLSLIFWNHLSQEEKLPNCEI